MARVRRSRETIRNHARAATRCPATTSLPDGKSLVVPIGGKLQRVDFATGQTRVIPMTVPVRAEIAPRVYTPVRVDDGPNVRARLIRWPTLSPDGSKLVFSAMNRLYVMDFAWRDAAPPHVRSPDG